MIAYKSLKRPLISIINEIKVSILCYCSNKFQSNIVYFFSCFIYSVGEICNKKDRNLKPITPILHFIEYIKLIATFLGYLYNYINKE